MAERRTRKRCRAPSISLEMSDDESTAPSGISMKSDSSKIQPISFGAKGLALSDDESTAPSGISMKSDASLDQPLSFELQKTQRLRTDPEHQSVTKEVTGDSQLLKRKKTLKEAMRKKVSLTCEGDRGSTVNTIYSGLIITTGESEGPHEERGFRHIKHKLDQTSDQLISLSDIVKPLPGQEQRRLTVLTKGIAGIGKSFAVQKFISEWVEEKENQDIDFLFCLAFREVNLSAGNKSLHKLLMEFHPVLWTLEDSEVYLKTRVMVILDGLDESRLQLDFDSNTKVTSVREVTSVGNLLTNLIQGNLLPNARLWITSRPAAAASQIPAKHVDIVTEIRGFSDRGKEMYFRRKFSGDLNLAERIISHIHSSQTLDIMCQIPIFCWISAALFQEFFGGDQKDEIPQTLTEMMAHFLFVQTKVRNTKYQEKTEITRKTLLGTYRDFLLKLGKLAFVHLQRNNLIFYDEDLEECGIDIQEAAVYSGFWNSVLRDEQVFSQKKVFFFVHLTIQEFFAALFVYDCFISNNTKELSGFLSLKDEEHTLLALLKMVVEKVVEERNGHLDFFLRFLLGLMVEPNRRPLHGLLTPLDPSKDVDKKILSHLKAIRRKGLSPDSSINLFQTMVEMRDHKVKDEIEEYLKFPERSKTELTPLHCSALAYMLQVSKNDLDMLDLKDYNTSEEGQRRLIPAVRSSREARLADCKVTEEWVEHLAFGLKFPYIPLRVLDLSNNDLRDSGVSLLCDGLSQPSCKLEKLKLSGCLVTKEGCTSLYNALKSNPSHLVALDLNYNNPGDSGVESLRRLEKDPQYKLSTLDVNYAGIHRMKPGFKKYACELTLDPNTAHKNLLLSEDKMKVTWVENKQLHPRHQDRFDHCQQVLCEQGLEERCYFEVEVFEPYSIGLAYRAIGRKGNGDDCKLDRSKKAWCLICSDDGCFAVHGGEKVSVPSLCSRSSRVGVYLDWPAGTLSFYRVSSESRNRLYTFKTDFSEPLYPAVELHTNSSALFCQLT